MVTQTPLKDEDNSSPSTKKNVLKSPFVRQRIIFDGLSGKLMNNNTSRLSIESIGYEISTNGSLMEEKRKISFTKEQKDNILLISQLNPSQNTQLSHNRKRSQGSLINFQLPKCVGLNRKLNKSTLNFFKPSQQQQNAEPEEEEQFTLLNRYNTPDEEVFSQPKQGLLLTNQLSRQYSKIETQEFSMRQKRYTQGYKKLDQIIESNKYFNESDPLDVEMFKLTQNNNVMPRKLGLLNNFYLSINGDSNHHDSYQVTNNSIDLSNQRISIEYAKMVAQALKHQDLQSLTSIKLTNNNITNSCLNELCNSFPYQLKSLNLLNNDLGPHCQSLIPILNTINYPKLTVLNLEHNKIGDLGIRVLLQALIKNRSLQSLNLSQNNLSDASGDIIASYISESSDLQELYLHWNKLSSQGGIPIAEALSSNNHLEVLDLSHNSLGHPRGWKCVLKILKGCSHQTTSMKHIDLSFNMIGEQEIQEIATFINSNNTTLFGIHLEGNEGQYHIDTRGFLVHQPNYIEITPLIHYSQNSRINGVQSLASHIKKSDICWICQGWQEIKFEIKAGCSSRYMGKPVFLHLDFEDYRPHYMDEDPIQEGVFVLYRLCPPNRKVHFFFSDPTQPVIFYSNDYNKRSFVKGEEIIKQETITSPQKQTVAQARHQRYKMFFEKKTIDMQYLDSTVISYQEPFFVNYIDVSNNQSIISHRDYEVNAISKPRQQETYFKITVTNEWTFEKSLFRTYIRDSIDLENQCFEFDWQESRLDKYIPSQKEECKEYLRKQYGVIKRVYKYFASIGIVGDIPSISLNLFSQIAQRLKIYDGKLFKLSDLDFNFITVNANFEKQRNYRNPDKAIVRYEFLEVLPRIILDKYTKSEMALSPLQAFKLFFEDNTSRFDNTFADIQISQEWRDQRYWNKQNDDIFKNYMSLVQELWERFADSRKTEKRYFSTVRTMNIFEFSDFVKQFDLLDDQLTERDINLSFNQAIMTQVDELNSDKFIQMTFVEFLEALARLAEKKSMIPLGTVEEYSLQERIDNLLQYKLESMLELIKNKLEGDGKQNRERKITLPSLQVSQQRNSLYSNSLNFGNSSPMFVSRQSPTASQFQKMIESKADVRKSRYNNPIGDSPSSFTKAINKNM